MAKRSSTLETTLLALEILRRIPRAPRATTASELHGQLSAIGFDRDLRTIQRQLEMLSAHLDIECNDSVAPYQYRWLPNAQPFAIPHLSPQESLLLTLAEAHLRNLLPAHLMKSMHGFFTQARHNLNPEDTAQHSRLERQWPSKIRMVATSQPLLPPKIVPGVLETVSEALYHNHRLRLDYKNAGGRRNTIEVLPLGLAQQGPRLYLVCRYVGFDNERSLAVHRILSAEQASTIAFERPAGFDLEKYDADGRFRFGEGQRIRLRFRIDRGTGHHLLETPLSKDQRVTELDDDRLEITATVVDSAMLDQWLRGFGDAVEGVQKDAVT
jgi:predicted DNA-binding transcriptional regulator YafY